MELSQIIVMSNGQNYMKNGQLYTNELYYSNILINNYIK